VPLVRAPRRALSYVAVLPGRGLGLRGLSRRKIVAAAQVDGGGPIRQRVSGLPPRVPS